jgi:hypothetical protein
MDVPYAKPGTTEWHIMHGLNPGVNLGVIWAAAVIFTGGPALVV